jgi:hypothetical protein
MKRLQSKLEVSILAMVFLLLWGVNAFAGEIRLGAGDTAMFQ